ncbi:hypothetical protein CPT_MTx_010 [Serratia phage MTx]|uniref:Uncharacterized protein n=1 Tax=Serratia phage MTx TaxID=2557553 RepID=A0A482MH94_9CAUD|nr:hypothetical protein HWC15_gp010 [Serratia phage MTx]QBQ72316.1 hypothetical protein CPT_MTx_010 [Serratia phage MTx]
MSTFKVPAGLKGHTLSIDDNQFIGDDRRPFKDWLASTLGAPIERICYVIHTHQLCGEESQFMHFMETCSDYGAFTDNGYLKPHRIGGVYDEDDHDISWLTRVGDWPVICEESDGGFAVYFVLED